MPSKERRTRTYDAWRGMRRRCLRSYNKDWARYGGRGITICKEWDSYETFLADMGECPAGLTLDRIDNDGPYCKANCRWATRAQQVENRTGVRWFEFNGKRLNRTEWAKELGIAPSAISHRLRNGWSVERAFTTPSKAVKPRAT